VSRSQKGRTWYYTVILAGSITDNTKVTSPQPALPRKWRVLTDGACYMLQQKGNISDDRYMLQQLSVWLCSFVFRLWNSCLLRRSYRKNEICEMRAYFHLCPLGQVLADSKLGGRSERLSPVFSGWMTMISLFQSVLLCTMALRKLWKHEYLFPPLMAKNLIVAVLYYV